MLYRLFVVLLFIELTYAMTCEKASTRLSIQAVKESYCSGICSVSSTMGTFADFAGIRDFARQLAFLLRIDDQKLASPAFSASVNCLISVGVGSLSFAVARAYPLGVASVKPMSSAR